MTPISLMPPVDHCPSCEGRRAESKALKVGEARAEQAELQSADGIAATPAPGASSADGPGSAVEADRAQPVATAVPSLLAPDLAVQASLGGSAAQPGDGDGQALRLRAAQAYQTV